MSSMSLYGSMVKNIKSFLALALVCLVFSACEKPTDPNENVPNSVTGKVILLNTDDSSKPFSDHSGVTVALRGTSLSSVTDSSGQYRIPDVPSGSYTITYTKPGFDTVSNNLEYSGTGVDSLDRVVLHSLLSAINSIRGKIVLLDFDSDTEFTDRSGVTISVAGTTSSGITNTAGEYRIDNIPAGSHEIRFEKPGFYTREVSMEYNGTGIKQLKTMTLHAYLKADIILNPITIIRASRLIGRDYVDSVVIDGDTNIYIAGRAISSQLNLMLFSGTLNLVDYNSFTIRLQNSDGKRVTATSTKLVTVANGNNYTIIADAAYVQTYLDGALEGKPTKAYLEAYYKFYYDIFSNEQPVPHP